MKIKKPFLCLAFLIVSLSSFSQDKKKEVPADKMQEIYTEVKTSFKYGLVLVPENNSQKLDCPTIFRNGEMWYMSFIIFDGRGYETWLAESKDLLHWEKIGRMLSFSKDTTVWDANQKAGYVALEDYKWGGSY
jgi:predicted GH43/DUF377 family glycosyl hydrolase